ncbi:hypothetical protein, partial [Saccharopolyspora sp. NPDC002578]
GVAVSASSAPQSRSAGARRGEANVGTTDAEWLRHEGKSCPREETAENPPVVGLLWWSLLSGFAADRTTIKRSF